MILLKILETMNTVLVMPLPPKACHVVGEDDDLLGGQVITVLVNRGVRLVETWSNLSMRMSRADFEVAGQNQRDVLSWQT